MESISQGAFEVSMKWTAAIVSSNVTSYVVEVRTNNTWIIAYQGNNLTYIIASLTPNTTYEFRLSAVNQYGPSNYTYINAATVIAGAPAIPTALSYSQYTRSTIRVKWNVPLTNGGLTLRGYRLRMLYNNSYTQWNVTALQYQVIGLIPNTKYTFSIAAYNDMYASAFSAPVNISTAAIMCGDGVCDPNENCSTCFFDCNSCGYNKCPSAANKTCNSNGVCAKGLCNCYNNWYGDACQYNVPIDGISTNNTSPSGNPVTGFQVKNESARLDVTFDIYFPSIREVDGTGKTIVSYNFDMFNRVATKITTSVYTQYTYRIIMPNKANVTILAYVYSQPASLLFANQTIQVPKNGLKYYLRIDYWPFAAYANRVLVALRTNARANAGSCVYEPESDALNDVNSDNLRSLSVTINGVTLDGKFMENGYLDGAIRLVKFEYNKTGNEVEIQIPHFWEYVEVDPNFQVLLDPVDKSSSSESPSSNGDCFGAVQAPKKKKSISYSLLFYWQALSSQKINKKNYQAIKIKFRQEYGK